MKLFKKRKFIISLLLSLFGLASIYRIGHSYGIKNILLEFSTSKYYLIVLILTFIPTLLCYSFSWLLITDHTKMKTSGGKFEKIRIFFKITVISVAWNNLTPFMKVGGEPLKYLMLKKYLSPPLAFSSTINYNVVHLISTLVCFVLASFIILLFYPPVLKIKVFLILIILLILMFLTFGIFKVNQKVDFIKRKYHFKWLRVGMLNLIILRRRLRLCLLKSPTNFFLSIGVDTFARFIEGITFYSAFKIIHKPLSFLSSTVLEIGRTFVDAIFFFIPYQVGSREKGIQVLMDDLLHVPSRGFLTVSLLYRFVEFTWVIVGYAIWGKLRTSVKEDTV
jgi:hypothetical protein